MYNLVEQFFYCLIHKFCNGLIYKEGCDTSWINFVNTLLMFNIFLFTSYDKLVILSFQKKVGERSSKATKTIFVKIINNQLYYFFPFISSS